jgi:hypothetical protein
MWLTTQRLRGDNGLEAERDERKKIEETWEAREWITRSRLEEDLFDVIYVLGYSAPWECLHHDSTCGPS